MVAMDILWFALFHKNNHHIADDITSKSSYDKRTCDENDTTENKKVCIKIETTSDTETLQRTKEYIWDEMTKCEKGQLSVDKICSENKDQKLVMKALNEMEEDRQIMMSNGKRFLF